MATAIEYNTSLDDSESDPAESYTESDSAIQKLN